MATLSSRMDYRGRWISIEHNGSIIMSAHQSEVAQNSPATIYWDGRTGAELLEGFFFSVLPPDTKRMGALIFTSASKLRLDLIQDQEQLHDLLPSDTLFLRLEAMTEMADAERALVEATFIVWSRIDAPQQRERKVGVFLTPSHAERIRGQLTKFISATTAERFSMDAIEKSLDLLGGRLVMSKEPA